MRGWQKPVISSSQAPSVPRKEVSLTPPMGTSTQEPEKWAALRASAGVWRDWAERPRLGSQAGSQQPLFPGSPSCCCWAPGPAPPALGVTAATAFPNRSRLGCCKGCPAGEGLKGWEGHGRK